MSAQTHEATRAFFTTFASGLLFGSIAGAAWGERTIAVLTALGAGAIAWVLVIAYARSQHGKSARARKRGK